MNTTGETDHQKATQTINYLARKEGGKINKLKLIKLIYFAERYHLRKHGRPIINDTYFAMQHGPVPSLVKDLAEMSDFLEPYEKEYAQEFIRPGELHFVDSLTEVDEDLFSDSELEALDFAYREFGDLTQYQLVDLTHEYPEWKQFEAAIASGRSREQMSYLDFFNNPEHLPEDKFNLSADILSVSREIFEEEQALLKLWQ